MRHHLDGRLRPLTPDATIKAVHEALEKVAQKIDPKSYANKLTVLKSHHMLASIISNHARRRELLYDIIHQERLNDVLKHLEVSITHTDVDVIQSQLRLTYHLYYWFTI